MSAKVIAIFLMTLILCMTIAHDGKGNCHRGHGVHRVLVLFLRDSLAPWFCFYPSRESSD